MSEDYYDNVFRKFMIERQHSVQGLFNRFRGVFRALVVETNDPLNLRRVRVRVPELHNSDLQVDRCPWASPAPWAGGSQCGAWTAPIINDIVFVMMEKNHPYSILYWAGGDATRRARYPLESVYTKSPANFDIESELFESEDDVNDYLDKWLPHDFRPMSHGLKDRYGNSLIFNATGYFPKDHAEESADPGFDPVNNRDIKFRSMGSPDENDPDAKYIGMMSKYGNCIILSDVGYKWSEEFVGDWDAADKEERKWERDRTKYYTRMFTEQSEKERDERRLEYRTRYGHLFEMRDVGWNKARDGEFGGSKSIASSNIKELVDKLPEEDDEGIDDVPNNSTSADQRWIKLRTKGGHLIQMMDYGMNPDSDNFVRRQLKNEFGGRVDEEERADFNGLHSDGFWSKDHRQDARWLRMLSRYGYKFAIDDRGTSTTSAEESASPVGNGIILRGRREVAGTELGFGLEFNEKDKLQHIMMYTPHSKVVEMNDKWDYTIICSDTHGHSSGHDPHIDDYDYNVQEKHEGRRDNEFSVRYSMCRKYQDIREETETIAGKDFKKWIDDSPKEKDFDPELRTHHLKIDRRNQYVRLKTHRKSGHSKGGSAGIEARCDVGHGGNWTEICDHQDRGLWLVEQDGEGKQPKTMVLRSNLENKEATTEPDMWLTFDEPEQKIVLKNKGKLIQIVCNQDIQVISETGNINIDAMKDITLKSRTGKILMQAQNLISMKSDTSAIKQQAQNEISIRSDSSRVILQGTSPWWQVGPSDIGTKFKVHASRYFGVFTDGDKFKIPGPAVTDSGNESQYGSPAINADPVKPVKPKLIKKWKPTGESDKPDAQRMNPSTSERAFDENAEKYKSDFAQRTKDIWND